MRKTVESIPQASLLLHSLRSVGYSEETAVADIVDNAISAEASEIYINFDWKNQLISIIDNGTGMGQEELYKNMQIGSSDPESPRSEKDLGRFGMGMKTAAFSMGLMVTVASLQNGQISNASWDLDQVANLGWKLIIDDSDNYTSYFSVCPNHGTAVIISKLDLFSDESDEEKKKTHFYNVIDQVANHLQLVFHKFIAEDQLKIYVNGNGPLEPWDPFALSNSATQELGDEEVWDPSYKTCTYIQPYVLPHKTMYPSEYEYEQAKGIKGWYRNQGIYLYRNRRLIIYGTWFNLIKKEMAFNLARIKVDITAEADADWKIDIKKAHASPPVYIREKLMSAIDDTTARSMKIFNARGSYTKRKENVPILDYVWEQVRNNGYYSFKINKKHPLLTKIRQQLDDNGKEQLRAYLSLVENFAPFMRNDLLNMVNTGTVRDEKQKKQDLLEIQQLITIFLKQGFSKDEIKNTILDMSIYSYLKEDINKMMEEQHD